jgi:hypothetical protein
VPWLGACESNAVGTFWIDLLGQPRPISLTTLYAVDAVLKDHRTLRCPSSAQPLPGSVEVLQSVPVGCRMGVDSAMMVVLSRGHRTEWALVEGRPSVDWATSSVVSRAGSWRPEAQGNDRMRRMDVGARKFLRFRAVDGQGRRRCRTHGGSGLLVLGPAMGAVEHLD